MSSDTNKLFLNLNPPRAKDLGFVSRFHHNYGFEDELFEYLLDQKDMWSEKLFYVNERQFSKWVEQGKHRVREVPIVRKGKGKGTGFPPMEVHEMSQESFEDSFGAAERIDIKITKGGYSSRHKLERGDCVSLKTGIDRNGLAVNVGGYVTAMKWLHYASGGSVLAVSVINNKDGLESSVGSPELSVFPKKYEVKGHIKSALQIWKYDVESSSLQLSQVYDTSSFGVTSRLAWLPAKFTEGNMGVLSGAFTDGRLHFFEIKTCDSKTDTNTETVYRKVVKPSWTISLRAERKTSTLPVPITAYDFIDHDKVLVGSFDGSVAEFVLPNYEDNFGNSRDGAEENGGDLKTENREDVGDSDNKDTQDSSGEKERNETAQELNIPSFVTYVSDSMITSICVADVHRSKVMLVNTATAQSFAIQYDQIRQGRVELGFTISTLQPMYHRTYRIFVYPDSAESMGYAFARHPHIKPSLLLRTELISSFHISEYLNHPFAVVGNTCGDVYVMNIGRKIFGMPKAQNKLVVPLKIWTLYKAPGESELTLCGDYIPVIPDRNEVMCTFTPPEVVISAAAWNENFEGSSTYAFGTYSGLLVLERLDPVLI